MSSDEALERLGSSSAEACIGVLEMFAPGKVTVGDPTVAPDSKAAFNGLRVPAVVVSPWARRGHVSSVVHDHTSLLAFVERKWNLPAMTYRDANAAPMLDFLDFSTPAFLTPPTLSAAPSPLGGRGCDTTDPGH